MNDQAPDYAEFREKQIAFHASCSGSLVLCLLIHLASPLYASSEVLRMTMVIVFFGCLASFAWSFTSPFSDYQSALTRWRYADAAPSIKNNAYRIARRKSRLFQVIGFLLTLASAFAGLAVLSGWPMFKGALERFQSELGVGSVVALLAVPLFIVFNGRKFREVYALQNQVDEEMEVSGVEPRTASSVAELEGSAREAAVEITGENRFRAGGYDWYWSDFYKNAAVFGQSGSGKTICVLNAILEGLVGSAGNASGAASGLILDPKGDFRDKIRVLCERYGRADDLVIIDPDDLALSINWNPLDSDDGSRQVAERFGAVMDTISPSGGDDKFWIDSSVNLVQNLIALLRHAQPDTPPSLVTIHDTAMSDAALEREFKKITWDIMQSSSEASRAVDYFVDVWNALPGNTKGTIRSFVSNMLGSFLVEPYDSLFAGKSTHTIQDIVHKGKILYVHMPIADKEVMAKVVSTFVKLEFYREVLKSTNKARPSFFLCDEFQSFFTVAQGLGDSDAFERTRQSNHANIVAFQNINALLKQTERREPVMNLLGNCATKLFLRNTDGDTNEYASALFGEQVETLSSSSVGISGGARGANSSSNVSGSAQYTAKVKKDEFSALAIPSVEDNIPYAETISHMAARSRVGSHKLRWKVHPITQD